MQVLLLPPVESEHRMSSSVFAGIRFTTAELFREEKTKAFEHDYPEDFTHDPKTGKPLWRTGIVCIDPDVDDDFDGEVFGLDADTPYHGEGLDYVVGKRLCGSDEDYAAQAIGSAPIDPDLLQVIYGEVQEALEPHGLWDKKRFGIHVVSTNNRY